MSSNFNLVSRDAQAALTEFSAAFDAALATVEPANQWATALGLSNTSAAIRTTYPIPVDAAGYKEDKGDVPLRDLFARSMSMTTKKWSDGVSALASVVEAPDFLGWGNAPQRIAIEGSRQPNRLVAALLKANPLLDFYREEFAGGSVASTIRLFADNHPVHIFDSSQGTFDNDQSAVALDEEMLTAAILRFAGRKAPNGTPMGLKLDTFLVPPALSVVADKFFSSDTLVLAVKNVAGAVVGGVPQNNIWGGGRFSVIVGDELLDDNVIYALDSKSGCVPWVVQTRGAPEEIVFDRTSDLYKTTYKIGVKYLLDMAAAAALPHAIERITITG